MKLHPEPYAMIQAGKKTIELRLYDEKRRLLREGDAIVFTNTATGQTLTADVEKLHIFENFAQLYRVLPLLRCGYTEANVAAARPEDMDRYYPAREQKACGVVGIQLRVTNRG